jgi:hypothetical protein
LNTIKPRQRYQFRKSSPYCFERGTIPIVLSLDGARIELITGFEVVVGVIAAGQRSPAIEVTVGLWCPEPEVRAHRAANAIANFGFKKGH